jgi:hypothetical protein
MDDQRSLEEIEAFKEKIRSIGFTYKGGGGYGRENFSARTNAEVCRQTEVTAEKLGRPVERVGERWV